MLSDHPKNYRIGAYNAPIHKDLDALSVEITKAAAENGGIAPDPYFIPNEKWLKLREYQADANNGTSVGKGDCEYMNFILRGVAVCPSPTPFKVNAAALERLRSAKPQLIDHL